MRGLAGRRAALGTSHEKERVIAPALEVLGLDVVVPPGFVSDQFGTFTREVKRRGSQLDAARAKAHAAMTLTGADIGIGSEGSFGLDPAFPLLPSNLELIVYIDRVLGIEVRGEYRSGTPAYGTAVSSVQEALAQARAWGFPEHGVVVRLSPRLPWVIYKDVRSEAELRSAVEKLLKIPFVSEVWLENDLRAHRNPTRMEAIAKAAEDLAHKLSTPCPRCEKPGFSQERAVAGKVCSTCKTPTDIIGSWVYRCSACGYEETRHEEGEGDPRHCATCNP